MMGREKKLDDAVVELNGVLPDVLNGCDGAGKFVVMKMPMSRNDESVGVFVDDKNDLLFIGSGEQFQQLAKELGFIGKCRWGVEYLTNGKRPDLPDALWVTVDLFNCTREIYLGDSVESGNFWLYSRSFKITDQRHKPADTSYLGQPPSELTNKTAAEARAQQLNGDIKTHLIDDAIDALGGKWELQVRSLLGDSYLVSHGGEYAVMPSAVDMSHFQSLPKVQYICTKAEFESRKAERQGKPSWSECPNWGCYLAQDSNGNWNWYAARPFLDDIPNWNTGDKFGFSQSGHVIGNWQDTLEQRPEVTKDVNPHKKITKGDLAKAGYIFCGDSFGFVQAKPESAGADWYDYERQQALKIPPVGIVCEVQAGRRWSKTHVVAHHIDGARAICCDDGFSCGELAYCAAIAFRPLDWDRNQEQPVQSPELSFHLATAQNELTSSAKLLPAESNLLQSITGVIAAIQAIREAV